MADRNLPVATDRLEAIIREAGELALADFREGQAATTNSSAKKDGSPVSDADLAVDRLLHERLTALHPEAGWMSEETADNPSRLDRRHVWIVDPIDGTRAFLNGRTGWCVSVALIEDGMPLFSALYAPKLDCYYEAHIGNGAWLNGNKLTVSTRTEVKGARKPAHNLAKDERIFTAVTCPNSIALRLAMVASGKADLVTTTRWGSEWDVAAAWLLVKEAGGVMTDIAGHDISFNQPNPRLLGLLACAPGIHDELREKLAPHLPKILAQEDERHRD